VEAWVSGHGRTTIEQPLRRRAMVEHNEKPLFRLTGTGAKIEIT
jgi:hypothetical protein